MKYLCSLCVTLFLMVSAIFLNSCSSNDINDNAAFTIKNDEYIVGIQYEKFEGKGKLTITEEEVSFLNETNNSPLFGLKSTIENKGAFRTTYKGLEWETKEAAPALSRILEIIKEHKKWKPVEENKTSYNKKTVYEKKYSFEECVVKIAFDEQENIRYIRSEDPALPFEINFR